MARTTTTFVTTDRSNATTRSTRSLLRTTVVAGLVAAAFATAVAAAVHAAGVSFEVVGATIPPSGVAEMTFVGAMLGGAVLAVVNRRSSWARRRFLQTTVALSAISCASSVSFPDDAATTLALAALHVLAASLVVPALACHAHD